MKMSFYRRVTDKYSIYIKVEASTNTVDTNVKMVEADTESKILFHSDYSQISLDFIESKYQSYQPNQILFEPIKYYTVDTRFDDYEDKILTIKAYTEKDILVDTIELDDPQQVANFQDKAEDIIADNEKEIYEEASDLYDSIYRDWEEYKLRDIIDVLNDLLKAKLPEDIKKTKYKDYLVKNSSISESLYIHLIESPPEPDEFDDDEHKQWHDNDDWDLKVRISSHEIPNSSSIYGKTDVNIKISATSKPEEIYSKFIQYISKIEDTPKYTDHITASTQQLNLKFADIMRSKDFQKIVIREAEVVENEGGLT